MSCAACNALDQLLQFQPRIYSAYHALDKNTELNSISKCKRVLEDACSIPSHDHEARRQYFRSIEILVERANKALEARITGADPVPGSDEACQEIISRYLSCGGC